MRILAFLNLLAAITMIHTVHAFPHPDLAVRQAENDLRNESHIFHHLDRNQRTANRDRERTHRNDAKRSGLAVARRVSERPRRARATRERRFIKNPDYSEGGGGGASPQPASSAASDTVATPAPGQAEKQPTSAGDH